MKRIVVPILVLLAVSPILLAAEAASPVPMFRFSFLERIRQESSENVGSLNEQAADSSSYLRIKSTVGLQITPSAHWQFGFKLTNENRYYIAPKTDPRIGKNFDLHEVLVEQLSARWTPLASLALTVGRQEIAFGEGFLFSDGTPLDGSRTNYYNALRFDSGVGRQGTLSTFYFFQPREDSLLPVLNSFHQKLIEQAEEGYGLYYTGKLGKAGAEGYLIQKNVRALGLLPGSHLTTLGTRWVVSLGRGLSATGEAAWQLGRTGEAGGTGSADRLAHGGYAHLDWLPGGKLPWKMAVTAGAVLLSGDDPATPDRLEGWDPLFSRFPKWSDSFIYHLARESRIAYWSNFTSLYAGVTFQPFAAVKVSTTLHFMGADRKTAKGGTLSGLGRNRGVLFIGRLQLDAGKNMAGHFIWESFSPGNFYVAKANSYTWLRFEWLFRF